MFDNAAIAREQTFERVPSVAKPNPFLIALQQHKAEQAQQQEEEEAIRRAATGLKSNGVKVATKSEALRSWDDLDTMNKILLSHVDPRDYLIWTLGIATGLRISDICNLRIYHVLDDDCSIRPRMKTVEKKTKKIQNCLITEVLRNALTQYFIAHAPDDPQKYLIRSRKTHGDAPLDTSQAYRIITSAGKESGIPINFGCHTMRKTFATIAECVCREYNITNESMYFVQGMLNHSDVRITQAYLGASQKAYDLIRTLVSDFMLGKTENKKLEIKIGGNYINELE